jgi:tRNA 2-thiouridine synthesizing protein A
MFHLTAKHDILDVRGLSCPEPVVMTRNILAGKSGVELTVLSDSKVSVENIRRFVTNSGYRFSVEADGAEFIIRINTK